MCISETRRFAPGQLTPRAAEKFASATVIATLGVDDWQVCQDAAALAEELVASLGAAVTAVTVSVHRGSVEVVAAGQDVHERREAFARKPFVTKIECSLP